MEAGKGSWHVRDVLFLPFLPSALPALPAPGPTRPRHNEDDMKRVMPATALAALIVTASVAASGCSYNRFVSQEEAVKAQWAQVENQLQRRNDLIPNLVESTKGFAQQERDVFNAIAESRAKLAGAQTPEQKIQAANEQSSALARLLVVVENYPRAQVQRDVRAADGRTRRDGESHRRGAHALQRESAGVQHRAALVPGQHHRRASSASRSTRSSRRRSRPRESRRSTSAARRPSSRQLPVGARRAVPPGAAVRARPLCPTCTA